MGKAYVYYSYEQWGRGYIGSRSRSPIGDDEYFGSFFDKDFSPTAKIILSEYETFEEAIKAEMELHYFFKVAKNPHFANRQQQTSEGWFWFGGRGKWSEEERSRRTGGTHNEEWRKNQSEGWTPEHRRRHGDKVRVALTGRSKTQEHKNNIGIAVKGRRYITNDVVTKKHDPDVPLPEGVRWGRAKGITKKKRG